MAATSSSARTFEEYEYASSERGPVLTDLTDCVAVVTGGCGGIGAALARRFAAEGARIVLADLDLDALADVRRELVENTGTEVLTVRTDVTEAEDVAALADSTVQHFGRVDVVCNNAGIVAGGLTWDISLDDWRRVIDVDLWGVIHGIRSFVPVLLTQQRATHIVNVASMAGVMSLAGIAPYVAAKHGVVGLSETLARDLAGIDAQVGVSVVCPGYVPTHLGLPDRTMPLPPAAAGQPTVDDVADAVRSAIAEDRFYVFTHQDSHDAVGYRSKSMRDGRFPPSPTG